MGQLCPEVPCTSGALTFSVEELFSEVHRHRNRR